MNNAPKGFESKDAMEVVDCANKLQSHMMKGMSSKESYDELEKTHSSKIIHLAMELLKQAVGSKNSPYKSLSDTINRCMEQLGDTTPQELNTVDGFYKVCEKAYKIFMDDEKGRALPIVFMYNQSNGTLGVSPITGSEGSPMDKLKQIVYTADPDAYCMCAEASMATHSYKTKKDKEKSKETIEGYKYGDIIEDPKSKDCVIMQGNDKTGKHKFVKCFMITGKTGSLKWKEKKEWSKKMESHKLP